MRETVAALRGLLVAIYETMECYGGMASEERSLYGQIGYFAVLDLEERHIDHLIRRSNDGAYDQDPVQEEPESKRIQKEDPGIPTTRLVAYSEIGSFAHAVIDGKVPSMGHCTKQLQVMADVGEMDGLDRRDMYISRVSEILAEHLRQGKHIDVAMADTVNQLRIAYEEADREAALEAERRLSVATEFVMEHGGPHFVSIAMRGGLMGPDEGERLRAVADVGELDDPEGWERYAFKVGAVLEEHLSQGKRIDAAIADTIDQLRRARKEADEPVYDEEAPALGWWSCCDVC
jgi:hypothetical protein